MIPSRHSPQRNHTAGRHRRGLVLILVLIVIAALALTAYTFSDLMLTHRHAAKVNGQRLQARYLVDSGVESIKLYLALDPTSQSEMGGHFNNPLMFQGMVVLPEVDADSRGCFSVLAPYVDETGMGAVVRYGLEDESVRINLNGVLLADEVLEGAGRTLLMTLPGMTEDVADSILDWMDEDDEPRDYGAEIEYYGSLSPPYRPRNGPLLSVEELLLVRGVTPQAFFGVDMNRNGLADPHESQSQMTGGGALLSAPATSTMMADPLMSMGTPGWVERGWSGYLTLYSAEANMSADGLPRIHLNQDDLQQLNDELLELFPQEWINFIIAYRLYGASQQAGGEQGDSQSVSAEEISLDLTQQAQAQFSQVLDLIDARIELPQEGNRGGGGDDQESPPKIVTCPFPNDPASMAEYLPLLMDYCTVVDSPSIPARININQAPQEVLLGIPGMTEEIAEQIVSLRSTVVEGDTTGREHETWLLSEGIATLEEMRSLLPFVCAGGDVYRGQIVGYFQGGGPSTRVEVVFDATESQPRVLFWRDISHLGRGFALETLGADLLQGGGAGALPVQQGF
jgi:DNA uptake protein ComE-like DNA-binding protein